MQFATCISGRGSCCDLTIYSCLNVPVGVNSHRREVMSDGAPSAPLAVTAGKYGPGSLIDIGFGGTRR
jgi:hypothetical protein